MSMTKWEDIISPLAERIAKEIEQEAKEAEAVMFDACTFGAGYMQIVDGRRKRLPPSEVKG